MKSLVLAAFSLFVLALSPIAALAQVEGSQIRLKGEVFTADGREMHAGEIVYEASSDGPAQLADQLLANASDELRSMFAS